MVVVVGGWVAGGLFDFRVTPNPNFMLDVNLDVEFDKNGLYVRGEMWWEKREVVSLQHGNGKAAKRREV